MNLLLAHKIIASAQQQSLGPLKVHDHEQVEEVHLMAEAGLIEADESDPEEAVITRITHAGRQFYRAFKDARGYLESRTGQRQTAH